MQTINAPRHNTHQKLGQGEYESRTLEGRYNNKRLVCMERLYCLLVTDFLLLSQLFVIPCAFIIILDAVNKLLCINTIISQENFIVTRALNIILDAIDIISRMHTVI